MEELTVSFGYTKDDVMNFVLDSFSFEKVRCTLFLIFNITSFVIGTVFLFTGKIPLGIIFIAISIGIFPIMLILSYITIYNSLKVLSSVVCTLKSDGVDFISNFGQELIEYKDIFDIKITNQLIFMYLDKKKALVIPKRAFNSKDKALDFAALLVSKYKSVD